MMNFGTYRIARFAMMALLAAPLAAGVEIAAQVVPLPIADAPLAGATPTNCSTAIPVYSAPGTTGETIGDGCPAADANMSNLDGAVVDQYGNVFFADDNHYTIRVVYEGGASVAAAIVAAQALPTTLTTANIQKGYVYTIVGSYGLNGTTIVAPVSPYYCNQVSGAIASPASSMLTGCPGAYTYINPRVVELDADGNVFYTSGAGRSSIQVFYIGGAKAAALITQQYKLNGITLATVQPGYTYWLGGTGGGYGGDGLPATNSAVYMDSMRNILVDSNENIIFADQFNSLVRVIYNAGPLPGFPVGTLKAGYIYTLAGTCVPTSTTADSPCESATVRGLAANYGDGGPATSAAFNWTFSMAFDSNGNLFIGDTGAYTASPNPAPDTPPYGRVRVIYNAGTLPGISNPTPGYIYTYAGGGSSILTNTQALQVQFDAVTGLTVDASGYLYVTDKRYNTTTSNHIWRIDPVTGIATIIAGTGGAGLGTATPPAFLYCSTGSGTTGSGPTHTDKYGSGCPGPQAPMNGPVGNFTFDKQGNAYVADQGYAIIRKFSYNNVFPTGPAGTAGTPQYVAFDVPNTTVTTSLTLQAEGSTSTEFTDVGGTADTCALPKTFTADTICSFDLRFTPAKAGLRLGNIQVNTAAGAVGTEFLSGLGTAGLLTIDPGTQGTLGSGIKPTGVAVDDQGNAYLSDSTGNQVLKIPTGGGTAMAVVTGLSGPTQVAVDGQGTIYVADTGNNRVVRKTIGGVTTYLGTGLSKPQGVAVDYDGNVYVADTGNARVVELGAITGTQTVVNVDVNGTALVGPTSLNVDSLGNLYIVDTGSAAPNKIVEIIAAGGEQGITVTGSTSPVAVGTDLAGDLFVVDPVAQEVFELAPGATSPTAVSSGLVSPVGLAVDASGNLYVADPGNTGSPITTVTTVNRTTASLVFPTTDIKSTSFPTLPMTLTSAGNLSATLATPLDTDSNATVFPVAGATTNACTAAEVLASAATCGESATFHPTVTGPQTAVITYPSTGNTVTANLSGNAVSLVLTTSTLTSSPISPINVGQSVTITDVITLTAGGTFAGTGTVLFTVDGVKKPVITLPASLTETLTGLTVGTHTITASYSGDGTYSPSTGTLSIAIQKIPTTTSNTVTQGVGGPSVTAAYTPTTLNGLTATGTVSFTLDGTAKPVNPGTATIGPLNLSNGTHTVCATYSGDANFATSTTTPCTTLTIALIPTATLEKVTQASVGPTVTATVTPTSMPYALTGTITFTVNGVAGAALTINAANGASDGPLVLPDGANTVVATYSGDGNYATSTTTINLPVQKVGTSFQLNVTTVTGGDQFQIVFTTAAAFTSGGVPIPPTGAFAISLEGTNIKNNTITSPTLFNGSYMYTYTSSPQANTFTDSTAAQVVATYPGDGNYEPYSLSPTIVVYHEPTAITAAVVRGAGGSVVSGTITPTNGTYPTLPNSLGQPLVSGTVTIYRDGVAIPTATTNPNPVILTAANPAAYSYVDLTELDGPHTYYAIYNANQSTDGNYAKSTSNTTPSITVLHAPTTTTLAVSGGGTAAVPAIVLTATVTSTTPGQFGGYVSFSQGATVLGTAAVAPNGVATYYGQLVYPAYTFSANFLGDGNYLPSASGNVTEGIDLAVAPMVTTFGVPVNSQYPDSFTLASIEGYSGTLKPSCSGLPANALCRFDNQALVVSPGVNATSNLVIYSDINPGTASLRENTKTSYLALILGWPAGIMALLVLRRRRKVPMLLGMIALLVLSVGFVGCGSGTNSNVLNVTPAGTVPVTVTYTDGNNFSKSVVLTVTFY